jgi:hypothetical protein
MITKYREFLLLSQGFYLDLIARIYAMGNGSQKGRDAIILELGLVLIISTSRTCNSKSGHSGETKLLSQSPASRSDASAIDASIFRCLVALGDIGRVIYLL